MRHHRVESQSAFPPAAAPFAQPIRGSWLLVGFYLFIGNASRLHIEVTFFAAARLAAPLRSVPGSRRTPANKRVSRLSSGTTDAASAVPCSEVIQLILGQRTLPDKCPYFPIIRLHVHFTGRFNRLSTIRPGSSFLFREMPSVTPGAQIGTKFFWRIGGCDLVRGCRQSFTFACVLPLAADRTF